MVLKGLDDLTLGRDSIEALRVSIGAPRLQGAGIEVPPILSDANHRLYFKLGEIHGNDAHSKYNALIRRLVGFERALDQLSSRAHMPP